MILRTLFGHDRRDRAAQAVQDRIDPRIWQTVLEDLPFLQTLTADELGQLQARAAWLLACKTFNGAAGLDLTDRMRLAIAAQAALPVLHLDPTLYDGWDEIIVYPSGFTVERSHQDDSGVVHEYEDELTGEAWEGGPLILSWADSQNTSSAYNVVIHEFAHKLDLRWGDADGMPELSAHRDSDPRQWRRVLEESLTDFCDALDALEAAIPPDVDPESAEASAWYDQLPLDPYAATDEAEFFAVSSEHFFTDPAPLAAALPALYGLLATYYRQDPLARLAAADAPASVRPQQPSRQSRPSTAD